jgi:hypothetical protein
MRIRPQVIKVAPIQSTRLSSSVEGSSLSMAKNPKTKHAKVKPDNKYKGLLQAGLQRSQTSTAYTNVCSPSPGQLCEDTAENGAEGCPDWSASGKGCEGDGT